MSTRGPERQVSDQEILACFDDVDKPFVTTSDIATRVELSKTRIRQRIQSIRTEQQIERHKVGNAVVYWLPDDTSGSS
jgi:response regulator of citrate/malate metabolism